MARMTNIYVYKCKATILTLKGIKEMDLYMEKEQSYGSLTILENGVPKYDVPGFNSDGSNNEITVYWMNRGMDFNQFGKDLAKRLGQNRFQVIGEPDWSYIVLKRSEWINTLFSVEEFPIDLFNKLYPSS